MIKIGIVGGTGYVAGELLRNLIHHPEVEIDFVYSHSQPGEPIQKVHQDLFWQDGLLFSSEINPEVDLVFLSIGHGYSRNFLLQHRFSQQTKVVDLSNEFRLNEDSNLGENNFVYGLPELNRDRIKQSSHIANPGCFASAIQLALLPLASKDILQQDVHIHAITGSTGAGQSLKETSHFSWRNNNLSVYKAFQHQHLGEIQESLGAVQQSQLPDLNFLPMRGNFTRGIFASIYCNCNWTESELQDLYLAYYQTAVFTHLSDQEVHLKQVVNTNNCALQVRKIDGKVLIISAIDNLLKGAAGQAIQNMNLMFGLKENTGLQLKASYF